MGSIWSEPDVIEAERSGGTRSLAVAAETLPPAGQQLADSLALLLANQGPLGLMTPAAIAGGAYLGARVLRKTAYAPVGAAVGAALAWELIVLLTASAPQPEVAA